MSRIYSFTIPTGARDLHLPRVKSGNSTGALPRATDISESGEITLHVAASYTSCSGWARSRTARMNRASVM